MRSTHNVSPTTSRVCNTSCTVGAENVTVVRPPFICEVTADRRMELVSSCLIPESFVDSSARFRLFRPFLGPGANNRLNSSHRESPLSSFPPDPCLNIPTHPTSVHTRRLTTRFINAILWMFDLLYHFCMLWVVINGSLNSRIELLLVDANLTGKIYGVANLGLRMAADGLLITRMIQTCKMWDKKYF